MKVTSAPSHSVQICIAGNRNDAARVCRKYCMEVGLCVTITDADYIYTGGQESGVVVGLINYPRFPATPEAIQEKAVSLGMHLMNELCQHSFCVVDQVNTVWYSRRPD